MTDDERQPEELRPDDYDEREPIAEEPDWLRTQIAFVETVVMQALAIDDSIDSACRLLVALRDGKADLASVFDAVEREVVNRAGSRTLQVAGVGEVAVRRKTKRTKWRHDELLKAVVARLSDERWVFYDDDGELLPPVERSARFTSRLRDCVSFGAGKITGLKELGLQADEFCDSTDDGWSVQLPSRS